MNYRDLYWQRPALNCWYGLGIRLGLRSMKSKMKQKIIALPKLNRLSPTMESTALKLMEEAGELAQAIGKFRGLNGEPERQEEDKVISCITEELLDVAQTAVSMMFVLEEQYQVNIDEAVTQHVEKLRAKGYLSNI